MQVKSGNLVWYKKSLMSDRLIGLILESKKYDFEFEGISKYKILSTHGKLDFILDDFDLKIKVIQ
jgi:hypothetical protein